MSVQLVVFDLDLTLWDCGGTWVDCTLPPYSQREGKVYDSRGAAMCLYPDVPRILDYCHTNGIATALASRTNEPDWARALMPLLGIDGLFADEQIYPGSKVSHFQKIKQTLAIDYHNMVFFDDEMRNVQEVGALGVNAVYVEGGLNWSLFERTIGAHGSSKQKRQANLL